ncbi:NAD-dependent epimerase/dehydratase family protein [Pseudomonas tohonis]|nr:hypothetical protein L682_16190 [Pseudomonas alcaligenes OT 69]MDN4147820.1 NAD-dependent epimerase/dehydratase family protein [Pseudomonas tohonis]
MIISALRCEVPATEQRLVLIFGVGLIGGAVLQSLRKVEASRPLVLSLHWLDRRRRLEDLSAIRQALLEHHQRVGSIRRVDILWAAGKAGFHAGREELRLELDAFEDVVEWTRSINTTFPDALGVFHMLSSAGGLFEGQRFIDRSSEPRPLRPYGEAKLLQENIVGQLRGEMIAHIYRPSSVYGFSGLTGRSGLVNTLIENSKKHAASGIFGGLDTLRDYVLSTDIGDYIRMKMEQVGTASETFLLANGKPTSVHEMLLMVGQAIERPHYLSFDVRPSNASHITYRKSALPKDWRPTDLRTGIHRVARQLALSFESGRMNTTSK